MTLIEFCQAVGATVEHVREAAKGTENPVEAVKGDGYALRYVDISIFEQS